MSDPRGALPADALLCVANYPANTGYAWDFIESLYARVADRLASESYRTFVAYPRIDEPPRTLRASAASAVVLDATLRNWGSVVETVRFVRRHRVRAIYMTDRPAYSPKYAVLRAAGVRRIVVHRHNAGGKTPASGFARGVKWMVARVPFISADTVVAVSDFVVRAQRATTVAPAARFVRIWNGVALPPPVAGETRSAHALFGFDPARPLFACACRTVALKGVAQLLRAFQRMLQTWPPDRPRPALVYIGDGPQFAEIKALHATLPAREDMVLTGYRSDANQLLAGADVCLAPSIAADAFPLSVLHPMSLGKPVIGSDIGGIPEMVEDRVTGLLVPPGDEQRLEAAMRELALDPELARRLGRTARERVRERFSPEEQISSLVAIVRPQ